VNLLVAGGLVDVGDGCFRRADVRLVAGRIDAVGRLRPAPGDTVLDATERLVVPGLVNAHLHSNEMWQRAQFDRYPLETWVAQAYPLVGATRQTSEEIYLRTALGAAEMLRSGVTSVVDCLYEPLGATAESLAAVVRAYRDTGLRALICLAVADRPLGLDRALLQATDAALLDAVRPAPAADQIAAVLDLARLFDRPGEGVSIGVAPAGVHRCSDRLLELVASSGLEVHMHLAETRTQAAEAAASGRSLVQRAGDLGVLGPRTHLSHAIWLSSQDVAEVATSGATVVHNPVSNLKLGSGLAPVAELLRSGVSIALGTDGVCSADRLDLLMATKLAAILHRGPGDPDDWVAAGDAWRMTTVGGARALGQADELGRLEVGRRADLTLLDLEHPAFVPLGMPLLHVALGAASAAVREVIVGGRVVVANGAVTGVDEQALRREGRQAAAVVRAREAPAREFASRLVPAVEAHRRISVALPVPVQHALPHHDVSLTEPVLTAFAVRGGSVAPTCGTTTATANGSER
jgi:5-methylthioadenosine/S-adenosylhomocysteine deaminase